MTARSRRNKVLYYSKKLLDDLDHLEEHLKDIDLIANGESKYITDTVQQLVILVEGMRTIFKDFRKGL